MIPIGATNGQEPLPPLSAVKADFCFFLSKRPCNIEHFIELFGQQSSVILIPKGATNAPPPPESRSQNAPIKLGMFSTSLADNQY